ncbi:MAG: hypothetical protein FJZ47_07135 [Candidatus Tectomicrobia bacterium]|uniref:Uncharacterized protein n=1 Tax=Tectimicrobiota bacterium TaxID=2528274 RepID=A0A938B388_UNCTE|nr:hypothetical protein [Candidatus Tectomicrobia bacterium]
MAFADVLEQIMRLLQKQGRISHTALQRRFYLLTPIDGWFTEGFDTVDLQEASALLRALA